MYLVPLIPRDDQKTRGPGWRDEMAKEDARLTQLIGTLFDEGFRIPQTAGMLNTSPARVKTRLARCGKLAERKEHI